MASSGAEPYQVLLVHEDPAARARVLGLLEGSANRVGHSDSLELAFEKPGPAPDCLLLGISGDPRVAPDHLRLAAGLAPEAAVVVLLDGEEQDWAGLVATAAGAQDSLVVAGLTRSQLHRAIRYAVERKRALRSGRLLREDEARAAERSRLERGLLPRPLVRDERLRCVTLYRPGAQQALLGGDFYDVVELPSGEVLAVIGDVAGHGADQAAFGVQLRVAWRTLALIGVTGPDTLAALETVLLAERHDAELFVTACQVMISPDRQSAQVRCAGHPPPLLLGSKGGAKVPSVPVGPPLGVVEAASWAPATVDLRGQEGLLLYTDGLVEGFTPGEDRHARLGIEGLTAIVAAQLAREGDLGALVARVVEQVEALNGGELVDDVAVLGLSLGRRPGPVPRPEGRPDGREV